MTEETNIPTVTVNDVASMLQIIDTAAARGAFRGEELSAVGGVRDRAAAFIDYIKAQVEANKAETPTE
jgi:hypothetical protein